MSIAPTALPSSASSSTSCTRCRTGVFQVSPRDSRVVACFSCGLRRAADVSVDPAGQMMERFYEVTHSALFAKPEGERIVDALIAKQVDPEPLLHSLVGVLSAEVDIASLFVEPIESAERHVRAVTPTHNRKWSKGEASAVASAEATLTRLRELMSGLEAAAQEMPGALVFFYCDVAHRIVGCRMVTLHQPERDARWISADGSRRGVFNHGLFNRTECPVELCRPSQLLVVQDELSALQVQTALARGAAALGVPASAGYAEICAVGESVDVETVRSICPVPPVVCFQSTPEGNALVEALRQRVTITASRLPAGKSLGDVISECQDKTSSLSALASLLSAATIRTRPYRALRDEIDEVRDLEGRKFPQYRAQRWAADILSKDLNERGSLFHDGRVGYVLLTDTKDVVPFDPDNAEYRLLMNQYGVGARDTLFKPLLAHLDTAARTRGTRTEVHPLAYFDQDRSICYLFDNASTVHRIAPTGVDAVENGTDGVLFLRDPKRLAWRLLDCLPQETNLAETLLGQIRLAPSELTPGDIRFLFRVWFYAMFFGRLFPTKVILATVGPKGSGKTTLHKRIGRLLYGPQFHPTDLSNDPKDMDAAITTEPFVVIDNADRHISWLDDKLAVAATGGSIKRRVLYTTNLMVEYPIVAALGITSRTPHFRREDVADRLLLIQVERFKEFVAAAHLDEGIERQRDALMTEVVLTLKEIVTALEQQRYEHPTTDFRMADFAEFAWKISPVLGVERAEVSEILKRVAAVQLDFTIEDDPVLLLIDQWLDVPTNVGRWVRTAKLFEDLTSLSRFASPTWTLPFKDVRELGQRIASLRATLAERYGYEEKKGHGGFKYVRLCRGSRDRAAAATASPLEQSA